MVPEVLSLFVTVFVVSYIWHMMGVTIGYHRLLAHRSFKCPKVVEYFWVMAGYLGFESSPIWWATTHRAHHRYADQPLDPHSPRVDWKMAYFGWIFQRQYPAHIDPATQGKDLIKDPIYRFLDGNGDPNRAHFLNMLICMSFRIVLLLCFGWTVALASLVAGLIVQQVPFLLNVACHLPWLGYKNYQTGDDSVNVWWVALLTAGEGWHNNHHAFPGSARSGFRRFEMDPSWLMLRFMRAIGLVSWMHEASIKSKFNAAVQPVPIASRQRVTVRQ